MTGTEPEKLSSEKTHAAFAESPYTKTALMKSRGLISCGYVGVHVISHGNPRT